MTIVGSIGSRLTESGSGIHMTASSIGTAAAFYVAGACVGAPWFFYLCRFFTGAGIGGEYAAINSAIDELIPARNRGQVDLTINGSYWVGSGVGGVAALLFLDQAIFATDLGWRLAFGIGALLGLAILLAIRQRATIPFREIAKVAVRLYPRRAVLGLALFVGQAFLYWGPGRFRAALYEAVAEGRAQRLSRGTYAPADPTALPLPR